MKTRSSIFVLLSLVLVIIVIAGALYMLKIDVFPKSEAKCTPRPYNQECDPNIDDVVSIYGPWFDSEKMYVIQEVLYNAFPLFFDALDEGRKNRYETTYQFVIFLELLRNTEREIYISAEPLDSKVQPYMLLRAQPILGFTLDKDASVPYVQTRWTGGPAGYFDQEPIKIDFKPYPGDRVFLYIGNGYYCYLVDSYQLVSRERDVEFTKCVVQP
jgi:hypothetical protein